MYEECTVMLVLSVAIISNYERKMGKKNISFREVQF